MELLNSLAFDYTLRTVALGAIVLGIFAGALGSFAVLRKQSLLGDAMSHAALPGVALAFLLTQSREPIFLLLGAIIAGWIGTLFMITIVRNTLVKKDAALGIILSVFFGLGIVLLSFIQRHPSAQKAGLHNFLFGNASTLLQEDVIVMVMLGVICLLGLALFWKEFKLLAFDQEFGQSLGFNMKFLDVLLTSLIVIAIVIGLQTVGVVLMSAMIIAPAVAARQWTNKLGVMVTLSAIFGAIAGLAGAITSSLIPKLPTGPTIVVYVSVIVIISLMLAPARGLLWDFLQARKNRDNIDIIKLMITLFRLSQSHRNPHYAHDISSINAPYGRDATKTLKLLEKIDWVTGKKDEWALTKRGLKEAQYLKNKFET